VKISTNSSAGNNIIEYTGDLATNQQEARSFIKDWFENRLMYFRFDSSIGITIDNRRYGTVNDLANIQALYDLGVPYVVDTNKQTHALTMEQLGTLLMEMKATGLNQYQLKWYIESAIDQCTTPEEIWTTLEGFLTQYPILEEQH